MRARATTPALWFLPQLRRGQRFQRFHVWGQQHHRGNAKADGQLLNAVNGEVSCPSLDMGHDGSVKARFERERFLGQACLSPEHHQIRSQKGTSLPCSQFKLVAIPHAVDQCLNLLPISQPRLSHNLIQITLGGLMWRRGLSDGQEDAEPFPTPTSIRTGTDGDAVEVDPGSGVAS